MCYEVSRGSVRLLSACILMLWDMFLCRWRIKVTGLALELVDSWVELGLSVVMEAFG